MVNPTPRIERARVQSIIANILTTVGIVPRSTGRGIPAMYSLPFNTFRFNKQPRRIRITVERSVKLSKFALTWAGRVE